MEENLIKFITAKSAKEKGLTYDEVGQSYRSNGNFTYGRNDQEFYPAPTQGVLQKWLREKHKISVEVFSLSHHNSIVFTYNIKKLLETTIEVLSKNNYVFNTYEECLENGLFNALQLIKTKEEPKFTKLDSIELNNLSNLKNPE